MKTNVIEIPYGTGHLDFAVPQEALRAVLVSDQHQLEQTPDGSALVRAAMEQPIGSARLSELAQGKKNIVLIASDHTRPVPSKVIVPLMLEEIRRGNPQAQITILIATGCHRGTSREELIAKFGEEIVRSERICVHDCDDQENLVFLGEMPSGSPLWLNRMACEADLLVAEGFIEPHFFAGFSGGRKSVLPGVAGRISVLGNHCSEFIADSHARTGQLEGNPIHRDMVWAAQKAKLAYIVNVIINENKEPIYAVAGDAIKAHEAGCKKLLSLCGVAAVPADIVITSNGGYPLDQNIYQAVKGMTAAEATVKEGGVIIMAAASGDGHGGESFYHQLADEPDIGKTLRIFLARGRDETVPDQWQTQIMIRVLQKASVIYISEAEDSLIRALHMIPAHTAQEALKLAGQLCGERGIENPSITVIPDGVSVMVR